MSCPDFFVVRKRLHFDLFALPEKVDVEEFVRLQSQFYKGRVEHFGPFFVIRVGPFQKFYEMVEVVEPETQFRVQRIRRDLEIEIVSVLGILGYLVKTFGDQRVEYVFVLVGHGRSCWIFI